MRLSLASIVILLASVVSAQDALKPNCHFQNIHYDRAMNVVDTFITGVNHNGSIVGGYDRLLQNGVEFRSSGFMHRNGTYFPIDVPWAKNTLPYSLNDRGEIVGVYSQSGVWKGLMLTAKGYAKISVPGFSSVTPSGINNVGMIVGTVDERHGSVLVEKGFAAKGGTVQLISFPGSSSTSLHGVNDEGTIVGSYGSPDGKTFHGLL